ncbi:MAG: hypothetical protein NXI31_24090 [bacterium]|nr:hypothetical protein [bacterium]
MTEIVRLPAPVRWRFLWLLPLWFAVWTLAGTAAAGHNGQLFFLGSLVGVWANALVDAEAGSGLAIGATLLGGVPLLALLGWLLDRLGADVWLFGVALALITVLSTYVLLQGHADFDAAIAHHGSMLAYLVCALQFGSYGATLVALVVQAGRGGRAFE